MARTAYWALGLSSALIGCGEDVKSRDDSGAADARVGDGGSASDASDHGWDGRIPEPGDVRINELDCTSDTVELVNVGNSAQSLADFALSDDLLMPAKIQPLEGSIAPAEYKVVALTSFGLKCSGEDLFLTRGDALVDVAPAGEVTTGASWGRLPDRTGDFALNQPTLGAANRPFVDASPALFQPFEAPVAIVFELDAASADALRRDPRTYVHGTLTVTAGGDTQGPYDVGVRIKGSIGSFRDFDSKPALKIDADRYVAGQRVFGQSKLTLNNLVQDSSTIHEWLGYQFFAAAGIPAPRTGYGNVTVNGADYGPYLVLEDTTTSTYLTQNFESTLGLYEPPEGSDLVPEQVPGFDVKQGSTSDFSQLLAIAEPLADGAHTTWFDAIGDNVDWPQVLRTQAVDMVSGNHDGYAVLRNNYMLHVDDAGVLRMMPWGIDASFTADVPFFSARGLLISRCLEDTRCTDLWLAALEDVHAKGAALLASDVAQKARQLGTLNAQRFANDSGWGGDAAAIPAEVQSALDRLELNLSNLSNGLACQRDTSNDTDGDGRRCELDCSEGDAARHRGATEVCGDRQDQNCNGVADDGPECPICVVDEGLSTLVVCPRAASIAALRTACQALGATPVTIESAEENESVIGAASQWFTDTDFFIGLSDEAVPETFAWTSGSSSDYRNFVDGYPYQLNPGQGARCAVASSGDGGWRTEPCDAHVPAVCER